MSEILTFFVVWLIAIAIVSLMYMDNKKFVATSIFMIFMFSLSVVQRWEFYTPVSGFPTEKFIYNHHKLVMTSESEPSVLLWVFLLDKQEEIMYSFPFKGNEDKKKDLDKIQELMREGRLGANPLEFYNNDKPRPNEISIPFVNNIVKSKNDYKNLTK